MKDRIISTHTELIEGREVTVKVIAPASSEREPETMQTHPTENAYQWMKRYEANRGWR